MCLRSPAFDARPCGVGTPPFPPLRFVETFTSGRIPPGSRQYSRADGASSPSCVCSLMVVLSWSITDGFASGDPVVMTVGRFRKLVDSHRSSSPVILLRAEGVHFGNRFHIRLRSRSLYKETGCPLRGPQRSLAVEALLHFVKYFLSASARGLSRCWSGVCTSTAAQAELQLLARKTYFVTGRHPSTWSRSFPHP